MKIISPILNDHYIFTNSQKHTLIFEYLKKYCSCILDSWKFQFSDYLEFQLPKNVINSLRNLTLKHVFKFYLIFSNRCNGYTSIYRFLQIGDLIGLRKSVEKKNKSPLQLIIHFKYSSKIKSSIKYFGFNTASTWHYIALIHNILQVL